MERAAVSADLLRSVVGYFRPCQVILFGSHARGEAGPDSDIDLVVVLDDEAPIEHLSASSACEARKGYRGSCDILAWRRNDFYRRARIVGSLPHTVLREGHVVYGEDLGTTATESMNAAPIDPVEQWREAQRRVAIADRDLRAVTICLQAEPPETETAAYHCQQAAEKLLKALLIAAARANRKTHDLDELAGDVADAHPHLATLPESCRFMTRWGIVYRYPIEPSAVAPRPPTTAEIGRAQSILANLKLAIAAENPEKPG